MTSAQDRLRRLAWAQGEMVKALEARLVQEQGKAVMLTSIRTELEAMATGARETRMAFLPAALRRLADTEAQLMQARVVIDNLRMQVLSAKGRQKSLATKARLLRQALERKQGEEEALETALGLAAKVSGKHDVVS